MNGLTKARIYDPEKYTDGFSVQFNPNTLRYSVGSNLKQSKEAQRRVKERGGATLQAQGDPTDQTGLARLSATLFFHTYESETSYTDVRQTVNKLRAFLRRSGDDKCVVSRRIAFAWGTLTMVGTLEGVDVTYQMFAADGTPVQAEVSISILGEDPDVTAAGSNNAVADHLQKSGVLREAEKTITKLTKWLFT